MCFNLLQAISIIVLRTRDLDGPENQRIRKEVVSLDHSSNIRRGDDPDVRPHKTLRGCFLFIVLAEAEPFKEQCSWGSLFSTYHLWKSEENLNNDTENIKEQL